MFAIHQIMLFVMILVSLLGLLMLNIFVGVRRKPNWISTSLQFSSIFLGMFLFCILMRIAIVDLEVEVYYLKASHIFLIGWLVSLLTTLFFWVAKKPWKWHSIFLNPDISSILTAVEETIIICDYNGLIIEMNHQGIWNTVLKECHQQDELLTQLLLLSREKQEVVQEKRNLIHPPVEFEIYSNQDVFLVSVLPIRGNQLKDLGTMIVLHNITEEKKLIQEVYESNEKLETANKQLVHFVEISSQLEEQKERLKLVEGIQSELLVRIEEIISEINELQQQENDPLEVFQNNVETISDQLRDILRLVRISVKNMNSNSFGGEYDSGIISR